MQCSNDDYGVHCVIQVQKQLFQEVAAAADPAGIGATAPVDLVNRQLTCLLTATACAAALVAVALLQQLQQLQQWQAHQQQQQQGQQQQQQQDEGEGQQGVVGLGSGAGQEMDTGVLVLLLQGMQEALANVPALLQVKCTSLPRNICLNVGRLLICA